MENTRIILAGLWIAFMFNNLWGDVLTIFSGEFESGKIGGMELSQGMWVGIAALMMIPMVMIVLTLTLKYPAIRWVNIIVGIFWIVFNLGSWSTYPYFNKFLIGVSFVFNAMTVWYAWKWVV
jgi:hypothetical protein